MSNIKYKDGFSSLVAIILVLGIIAVGIGGFVYLQTRQKVSFTNLPAPQKSLVDKETILNIEKLPAEILNPTKQKLCAYSGDPYFLFVEGSQCLALVWGANNQGFSIIVNEVISGKFSGEGFVGWRVSSDGKRNAYATTKSIFLDGKKLKDEVISQNYLQFSPDSKHFAYTTDHSAVLDGQESKSYPDGVYYPTFSPNSKRFAFTASVNDRNNRIKYEKAVIDNRESKLYGGFTFDEPTGIFYVIFSPDSKRIGYIASNKGSDGKREDIIVVDGKEVGKQKRAEGLTFSHDGNSIAYTAHEGGKQFVVQDEKQESKFDGIKYLSFVPNSTTLAYATQEGRFWYFIIGGEKSSAYTDIINAGFSLDGRHSFHIAQKEKRYYLIVDGKEISKSYLGKEIFEEGPSIIYGIQDTFFSPDGKRLSYTVYDQVRDGFLVVIDGVEQQNVYDYYRDGIPKTIFSPDSKHFMYFTNKDIVLNGKSGRHYDRVWTPMFSSDSKFVIYNASEQGNIYHIISSIEDF